MPYVSFYVRSREHQWKVRIRQVFAISERNQPVPLRSPGNGCRKTALRYFLSNNVDVSYYLNATLLAQNLILADACACVHVCVKSIFCFTKEEN